MAASRQATSPRWFDSSTRSEAAAPYPFLLGAIPLPLLLSSSSSSGSRASAARQSAGRTRSLHLPRFFSHPFRPFHGQNRPATTWTPLVPPGALPPRRPTPPSTLLAARLPKWTLLQKQFLWTGKTAFVGAAAKPALGFRR